MFVYGRSDGHSKLICGQLIPYLLQYYCPKLRTFQDDRSDIETRNKDRFEYRMFGQNCSKRWDDYRGITGRL